MYDRVKRTLSSASPGRVIVEYLFIEYAERQVKPMNDDQGWQCGFINVPKSDFAQKDSVAEFRDFVLDELNFSARTYEQFKRKSVVLKDYKFAVVEPSGLMREYATLGAKLMKDLGKGARGLMVVGRNLDLHAIQETDVFHKWFETYVKRPTSREAREEDYV